MPLTRCIGQSNKTLEAFYKEWAASDEVLSSDIGKTMLRIIEEINNVFVATDMFGSTSLAHLLLYPTATMETAWYLSIIANPREYYIEYKMPKDEQPWENATVKGIAQSLDEFMKYLIMAMTKCGGWAESKELAILYGQLNPENPGN